MINPDRKYWNEQQQLLRQSLFHGDDHPKSLALFLNQHAMVHASEMSHAGLWSFEDEVMDGINEQQMRLIPPNGNHSIAWILWHITRIEDVTMNLLVAGSQQVLFEENWLEGLKVSLRDTGNAMQAASLAQLSATLNVNVIRAYRLSVGRRTREIVKLLRPEQLRQKVEATRLRQISIQGAVLEAAKDLLDYWGGLTIAGLLLMPPTRHNFIHWNEAFRIKQKFR